MYCETPTFVKSLSYVACIAIAAAAGILASGDAEEHEFMTVSLDAASHARILHPDAADFAQTPLHKDTPRPKMMRRHSIGDSGSIEATDDPIGDKSVEAGSRLKEVPMQGSAGEMGRRVFPPNWEMQTEPGGSFACAVEGGDCCCKGDVRLGKENPSGVSHWTPWHAVDHWVTCDTSILGDPNEFDEHKYCECNGYCPITCDTPTEIVKMVPNINATACANSEGKTFRPGDKCVLQCEANYEPTSEALHCRTDRFGTGEHVWSPRNFSCEGVPCAAPTWIKDSEGPACREGSHILHGSTCATACKPGYIPSAAVLRCHLGMLDPPDFFCEPMSCGVTEGWIENEHEEGPCKEGDIVESGQKCHGHCKPGYIPSVNYLSCHLGVFSPDKFVCRPAPCGVPLGIANAAPSPCEELWSTYTSSSIPSGQICKPQCKNGFKPSVALMNCTLGNLTPSRFECENSPCAAPTNITNGANQSCKQGDHIEHDFACEAQCAHGYEPTVPSLSCTSGILSPSTFACQGAPCQLPSVNNAPEQTCSNYSAKTLSSGDSCTPTCNHGWMPSATTLTCKTGALSPATFSCEAAACAAPTDLNNTAGEACVEGSSISHGALCTARCADGYTPSQETLTCVRGQFRPRTFTCAPKPCSLPSDIHNIAHRPCTGFESSDHWMMPSGTNCTPHCRHHYTPTVSTLSCTLGVLSPPTFECRKPNPCRAETTTQFDVAFNGRSGTVPCWEGTTIQHTHECHAQCGAGYTASEVKLRCEDGNFFPPKFRCQRNKALGASARCLAPVGIDYARVRTCGEKISFTEREVCRPRCASGYVPDVTSLTCSGGTFDPPSFKCKLASSST